MGVVGYIGTLGKEVCFNEILLLGTTLFPATTGRNQIDAKNT